MSALRRVCVFCGSNTGRTAGYRRHLVHLVATGFGQPAHRSMLVTAESPDALLAAFAAYEAPLVAKWVGPVQA